MASETRPRLLFLVTEDWYFCSHRLSLAKAARAAGYDVVVATRVGEHRRLMEEAGLTVLPIRLRRRGHGPLAETRSFAEIVGIYRRLRPAIVHHVALKPAVFGSLAARLAGVGAVVNAIAGLGHVFSSGEPRARLLRPPLTAALKVALDRPGSHVIVQNDDDFAALVGKGVVAADRVTCIRGAGVDLTAFRPAPEPPGPVVAALVGRMLWSKGVGEAVEAARLLRRRGLAVRVALVGRPDPANQAAVGEDQLRRWHDEGVVEWWGHVENVAEVWERAHVALFPTFYGEGLPKSMLEAAACGRPLVSTDAPGCREFVEPGGNGLLIPRRDPAALAEAIATLAADPDLRRRMGEAARAKVARGYSDEAVNAATLAIYERLLAGREKAR